MARGTVNQKTNKSENTKRHIVSTFLDLMGEKFWEKITVIEICRKAQITRGTFYQYFGDIYDLLEQLEHALITDLTARLGKVQRSSGPHCRTGEFLTSFNCEPPASFLIWFEFCRDHRDAMMALLDRKYGDTYFVKKLKGILRTSIEQVMDQDGTANDELREHFLNVFLELHLLSAQTWLAGNEAEGAEGAESPGENPYLSVDDIVNLLNTMRVGSAYLSYVRREG